MLLLMPSVSGLFKWRQFEPEVILLAVGWYLRFLQAHHDVCWLNIPVDKVLFVNSGQSGSHLRRNFQRQFYVQSASALNEVMERFPLYKLHRVKVTAPGCAKVEDRRNVRVANACCCPGFTHKPKPR
jgi:hypothetical protein